MDAAEALALLELIEAQEEARNRRPSKDDYYKYLFGDSEIENNPDEDLWLGTPTIPSAHYLPNALLQMYEPNEYYGHGASKRFMVAKRKKRSSKLAQEIRHGLKDLLAKNKKHV